MLGSDNFITEIGKQPLKSIQPQPPMKTPYPKMVVTKNNTMMAEQLLAQIITDHRTVFKPSAHNHIPAAQTQKEIEHATKTAIEKEITIPSDLPIKE